MDSEQALRRIGEVGILPVIRAKSVDETLRCVDAIYAGGIPIVEITMTVPDAHRAIESAVKRYGKAVLIGAGTVTTAAEAERCIKAGAKFLVSPGLAVPVLHTASTFGILAIPGAFTPTEVMHALSEDARVIKIFPCSSGGGPQHLKALHGPFPNVALIPTGGVNASNAGQYFAAGAFALGAGGDLVDTAALRNGDLSKITNAAKQFVAAVSAARKSMHGSSTLSHVPNPVL
jgi:2-dehydro-3-deoxyphosphogluconate aldolase / (4S)-4-hydroxy-2-oxoglutarate aldolase